MKGRAVADGSKQRIWIGKEEAASPTVNLESLVMSMVIDGYERRDVATVDIGGAFLRADLQKGDHILIRITGEVVDVLCKVNPEYKKYVVTERGAKVLYVKRK